MKKEMLVNADTLKEKIIALIHKRSISIKDYRYYGYYARLL